MFYILSHFLIHRSFLCIVIIEKFWIELFVAYLTLYMKYGILLLSVTVGVLSLFPRRDCYELEQEFGRAFVFFLCVLHGYRSCVDCLRGSIGSCGGGQHVLRECVGSRGDIFLSGAEAHPVRCRFRCGHGFRRHLRLETLMDSGSSVNQPLRLMAWGLFFYQNYLLGEQAKYPFNNKISPIT